MRVCRVGTLAGGWLRFVCTAAQPNDAYLGLDDVTIHFEPYLEPIDPAVTQLRQLNPSSRRTPLVISEIMYHPGAYDPDERLEFVELFNSEPVAQDLSGFRLSGAVEFRFPADTVLSARSYLVIAGDVAAIRAACGITNVIGPWQGRLPNDGGVLRLCNERDAVLLEVSYADQWPWPVAADGAGHSLVLLRPDYGEGSVKAWGPSAFVGGSPGCPDPEYRDALDDVVINEWLANTDWESAHQVDFVELFNRGTQTVDISGCTLSDSAQQNRFTIPEGTRLGPGGFVCFVESNALEVGWPVVSSTNLGFSLSARGDEIFLKAPRGNRVLDAIRFGAQADGVAMGRHPDGAPRFQELSAPTPGTNNAAPLQREVVINEIMYHPISGDENDAYLELHNIGSNAVNVSHWRVEGGVRFTIPPGTVIPAGGFLVVAKNCTNLLAKYSHLDVSNTVGNFSGRLSDREERVALVRPEDPAVSDRDLVVVDEVSYEDGWTVWADGGGSSLELTDPRSDNRLGMNWADSDETAKAPWTTIEFTGMINPGAGAVAISNLYVYLLGQGECLLDNVEVFKQGESVNRVPSSDFEFGLGGWRAVGTHERSGLETTEGFLSWRSLRIRTTAAGKGYRELANNVSTVLSPPLSGGDVVTIRAKARWLRGCPNLVLNLEQPAWVEAAGRLAVPHNLGSPGLANTRRVANAGPAIWDVAHTPVLPQTNEPVLVTCRVDDPDGVGSVLLRYRVDPASALFTVPMRDDGAAGDERAGDGVYTACLPAQPAGNVVAFHIVASELANLPVTNRFPAAAERQRECLVRFGETLVGGVFGNYKAWMTATNLARWAARDVWSNEPLDATFVFGPYRVIYGAGIRHRGNWRSMQAATGPTGSVMCSYSIEIPKDDRFLGCTELKLDMTGHKNRDKTRQRERLCQWVARKLGLPSAYLRIVLFHINGVLREPLHDLQVPNEDFAQSYHPDDADPVVFKSESGKLFMNYLAVDGTKSKPQYRYYWRPYRTERSDDDFSPIFRLVDALNLVDPELYDQRTRALADTDTWVGYLAVNHILGNKDSWGYFWHNNACLYAPQDAPSELYLYDMDMAFERPYTEDVFFNGNESGADPDPVAQRIFVHPATGGVIGNT